MAPIRRDDFQGLQHKAPLGDAGMGKDQIAPMDLAAIIQKVQIQAARRIGNETLTPQGRFDFVQKCQQSKGLETGSNRGDGIQEWRVGGIGPGRVFIEWRERGDFNAGFA